MNIIIFGPPGAGKGTQSEFIVNNFKLFKLSTGDLLREEINKKTPLESLEDCELLRFLELGYDVKMIKMSDKSISVDTKENLREVIKRIKKI